MDFPILSFITFLPILGMVIIMPAQLSDRIFVVNVSVQSLVYGVATEFLESSRELAGDVRMDPQVLVLLLSDEARAVVVGDRKAARVAAVGAAAMPEAAMAEDDAAGWHFSRDRVELHVVRRHVACLVAAGHHAGRAVLFGEVADRPHAVQGEGLMGLLHGDQLVIRMQRLCALAGTQRNRAQ